jgi:hypothetical protein
MLLGSEPHPLIKGDERREIGEKIRGSAVNPATGCGAAHSAERDAIGVRAGRERLIMKRGRIVAGP